MAPRRAEGSRVHLIKVGQGSGGIAFVAHIAGFVIGVLAVFVMKKPQTPAELWR